MKKEFIEKAMGEFFMVVAGATFLFCIVAVIALLIFGLASLATILN